MSDADAAAIQSLPRGVKLPEKKSSRRRALGNAVPPEMAAAALRHLLPSPRRREAQDSP